MGKNKKLTPNELFDILQQAVDATDALVTAEKVKNLASGESLDIYVTQFPPVSEKGSITQRLKLSENYQLTVTRVNGEIKICWTDNPEPALAHAPYVIWYTRPASAASQQAPPRASGTAPRNA